MTFYWALAGLVRRCSRGPRAVWKLALLALGTAVAATMVGCGNPGHAGAAHAATRLVPVSLLVGVDVSGSTGQDLLTRKRYCAQLENAVNFAMPRETAVTIWYYDNVARIVYGPQVVQSGKDLRPIERDLQKYSSAERGTMQSVALREMLGRAQERPGRPYACFLLTDGEDDQPAMTKHLAQAMAADPDVRAVWLCGAKAEVRDPAHTGQARYFLREKITQALQPLALSGKGIISSEGQDTGSALDRFRRLVDGER